MTCPKCSRLLLGRALWCIVHGDAADVGMQPLVEEHKSSYPNRERKPEKHGTRYRYQLGCRCEECVQVNRKYQRNYRGTMTPAEVERWAEGIR